MGGTAGRKRAAGSREEEEAAQGRKAQTTAQGGWAENKLQLRREAVTKTGKAAPTIGYSFSLYGTQFPVQLLFFRVFWYVYWSPLKPFSLI